MIYKKKANIDVIIDIRNIKFNANKKVYIN